MNPATPSNLSSVRNKLNWVKQNMQIMGFPITMKRKSMYNVIVQMALLAES